MAFNSEEMEDLSADVVYEVHETEWEDISIEIRHCASWYGSKTANLLAQHVEIRSQNKEPLPISETGYKSIFLTKENPLEAFQGNVVFYVHSLLNEAAKSKKWQSQKEQMNQYSLF